MKKTSPPKSSKPRSKSPSRGEIFTLMLSEDMFRRLKQLAIKRHMSMGSIVVIAVRAFLARTSPSEIASQKSLTAPVPRPGCAASNL
jgi:hypothetical protein